MKTFRSCTSLRRLFACALLAFTTAGALAQPYVYLTEVPDYDWHAGCFGTASGNLAGFWDRHGYPNVYTGLVNSGVAPLTSGNGGIRSMWASQSGLDGRPGNQPGHMDDYWVSYEFTGQDPYVGANRTEHSPDCIGDFIGLSQNKWASLGGECRGNIDAYSFVFWDKTGNRRQNYYTTNADTYVPDIGSGLKEWMRWRGYDADVFTQLTDFNSERTTAAGFTYADVKREIDAGYPVLCYLQPAGVYSRTLGGASGVNPEIHGVMIFGYFSDPFSGIQNGVLIKTSWGTGFDPNFPGLAAQQWSGGSWLGLFPVRGVIGFRPKPKITSIERSGGNITLTWDGPQTSLHDFIAGTTTGPVQRYAVQRTANLAANDWKNITTPTNTMTATFAEPAGPTFYRVIIQ
jgi:hypothetical protein